MNAHIILCLCTDKVVPVTKYCLLLIKQTDIKIAQGFVCVCLYAFCFGSKVRWNWENCDIFF